MIHSFTTWYSSISFARAYCLFGRLVSVEIELATVDIFLVTVFINVKCFSFKSLDHTISSKFSPLYPPKEKIKETLGEEKDEPATGCDDPLGLAW
jgi:hypothetical protein